MFGYFNVALVVLMVGLAGATPQDDEDEYFELDQETVDSQGQPISSYNPSEDFSPIDSTVPQLPVISSQEDS